MSEHRRERAKEILHKAGYHKDPRTHAKHQEKQIASAVHQHEAHDHKGEKKTDIKFSSGGHVEGEGAKHRMDRYARGGKTKGNKTKVNVIVAPQGGGKQPVPVPIPVGAKPPMAGAGAPPIPPPGALPPGGGAMPPMKRGGHVKSTYPHMEGGAASGIGRLDKTHHEAKQPGGKRMRGGKC